MYGFSWDLQADEKSLGRPILADNVFTEIRVENKLFNLQYINICSVWANFNELLTLTNILERLGWAADLLAK